MVENEKLPAEYQADEMNYVNSEMLSEVRIMGAAEYEDSPDSFMQISQSSGNGEKFNENLIQIYPFLILNESFIISIIHFKDMPAGEFMDSETVVSHPSHHVEESWITLQHTNVTSSGFNYRQFQGVSEDDSLNRADGIKEDLSIRDLQEENVDSFEVNNMLKYNLLNFNFSI